MGSFNGDVLDYVEKVPDRSKREMGEKVK